MLCADTASHSAPPGAREAAWKQKEVLLPLCKEASGHRAVWNTSYAKEGVVLVLRPLEPPFSLVVAETVAYLSRGFIE